MSITVKHIGKVAQAEIALKGITVVAGVNASGKSTISKSLYTILDVFYHWKTKTNLQKTRSINKLIVDWAKNIDVFLWADAQTEIEVRREIRRLFRQKKLEKDVFFRKIEKIFAEAEIEDYEEEDFEQLYSQYEDIKEKNQFYYLGYLAQTVLDGVFYGQANTLNRKEKGLIAYKTEKTDLLLEIEENKICEIKKQNKMISHLHPIYITTSDLMDSVGTAKKLYTAQKTGGVSYANSQLTQLLMQEIFTEEYTAEEYEKLEQQKKQLAFILDKIVNGEMQMENQQLVYYDNECNAQLEFPNVASGMRIFMILKRLAANGVLLGNVCLIIDEPETNLHPEWQLKLAELLVILYQQMGIKIYINSHSPYFIRAMEYYADAYGVLDDSSFYFMDETEEGMFESQDVTENLGVIYDKLAEPFNAIM